METIKQNSFLRHHTAELDNLSRPDGSVILCQGKTTVQAAVYGPGNINATKELIYKANLEVIYRPKVGQAGCADKFQERIIRNTLEGLTMVNLYPHTGITVNIQVLCDEGSLLSCCINAACLATMDAGLSMKYLVCTVTCAFTNDDTIIVDPDLQEEKDARALMTFSFTSKDEKIITVHTTGRYSEADLKRGIEICRKCSTKIFVFYRDTARKRLSKEVTFLQISECFRNSKE